MVVNVRYRKSGEAAVASYNYTDIAEGTGIVTYYLADTYEGGALGFIMTTNSSLRSDGGSQNSGNQNNLAYEAKFDLDFDVQFNKPQRIKGVAYANIPWFLASSSGAPDGYVVITLYKWDGATETSIATATGRTQTEGGTESFFDNTIALDITSVTNIKAGEFLRCNVIYYARETGGNTYQMTVLHDPSNRTITVGSTTADLTNPTINIPFVLDL